MTRILLIATLLAGTAAPTLAATRVVERDVSITTADGTADAVLFSAARKGAPAVILWPDLGGLRPLYREMGRALAGEGFTVLVPNPFYRSAKATGEQLDLSDPAVRARRMEYRAAATDDGIARDTLAYLAFLDRARPGARAGTVGYDVGGSYAFRAAAAAPARIAAVVSIYGLGVATPRPNSPHLLVPKTKAAYLVVQARDDDGREPEDKADIARVVQAAGLSGDVTVYPADHGFADPAGVRSDPAAAARAWAAAVSFLKARLN
ncbi:MAG: dienelactone hydrolase family protein [Sphingomonas fennica]